MDDYREKPIMERPEWSFTSSDGEGQWFFIVAYLTSIILGFLTTLFFMNQLKATISLSLMKAIRVRSKKHRKFKNKAPGAAHVWKVETCSWARGRMCTVCLESVSPSPSPSQSIHCCDICSAVAHLSCSSNAYEDCKCVSMFGYKNVVHQWAIQWVEIADQPEESSFCGYCEEPCSGYLLGSSPFWYCMWCQRLVHVDCQTSFIREKGDVCDLGPFKRIILSPLYIKDLNKPGTGGLLRSLTHGANELASTVRERLRTRNKKRKKVNELSLDPANSIRVLSTTGSEDAHKLEKSPDGNYEHFDRTINITHQRRDSGSSAESNSEIYRIQGDAEGVLVVNIGSYMGGVALWQNEDDSYDNFQPQSMHDKLLEIVCFTGTWHLGRLQVGLSRARRLAQGHFIKFQLCAPMPVQVDGEPWYQQPCTIEVSHHSQAFMLKRVSEEPLGHAAATITNVLETAETNGIITAKQKKALIQEMALRLS